MGRVICDRGYSSAAWPTHLAVAYDRAAYRRRSWVERLWGRLKKWRAVATWYEKTAAAFLGVLLAAAMMDWLRHGLSHTA